MRAVSPSRTIRYKAGFKYQLQDRAAFALRVYPVRQTDSGFLHFGPSGLLVIDAGYAWDGPTDPAIDTKNFMRASLVHDALYQLIREGLLAPSFRKAADMELRRIALEDGMSSIRAAYVYWTCRVVGARNARPGMRPVLEAP